MADNDNLEKNGLEDKGVQSNASEPNSKLRGQFFLEASNTQNAFEGLTYNEVLAALREHELDGIVEEVVNMSDEDVAHSAKEYELMDNHEIDRRSSGKSFSNNVIEWPKPHEP